MDGSSISITVGPATRARAMASICCSPPEREPAGSARRCASTGKRSYIASMDLCAVLPRCHAPIRRFSSMVRVARICLPSGTWTSPRATSLCAGVRVTSRPWKVIRPADGRSMPETALITEDLPAPLAPTSVTREPGSARKETPRTASTRP